MLRRRVRRAFRRFSVSPVGMGLLSRLGAAYIRLVQRSVRWDVEGAEHMRAAEAGGAVIAAIWHGRLMMTPSVRPPGRRVFAMISRARDGDTITAVVGRFGIETARGSTYDRIKGEDKGGAEAFAAAEQALGDGHVAVLTPDGPKGPRMRAHHGAALLSISTGAPVLPFSISTGRGLHLQSWDRFLLSWPFGRGAVVWLPPMRPEGRGARVFSQAIEAALTEAQDRADAMVGRRTVPAEPAR